MFNSRVIHSRLLFIFPCFVFIACFFPKLSVADERQDLIVQFEAKLTELEPLRSRFPARISKELIELSPLLNKVSPVLQYRFVLLKAQSLTLSGQIDKAVDLLQQKLTTKTDSHLVEYHTRALVLLANIHTYNNQYSDALQALHQFLPLLSQVNNIDIEVLGYRQAIELFGLMKMHAEALKYAHILYAKLDNIQAPRFRCFTTSVYAESMDNVYRVNKQEWPSLFKLYTDALYECQEADETMMMAVALRGQASLLMEQNELVVARSKLERALALSLAVSYEYDVASALVLLAEVDKQEQQLITAKARLLKALSVANELGDKELLAKIYLPLSTLSEKLGETPEALQYRKQYQDNYFAVLGETQSLIIAFETSKLDFLEKERQLSFLNRERDLYLANKQIAERERTNMLLFVTLLVGGVCFLVILAAVSVKQKRTYKRLAQTDALTGIYNRGAGQNLGENTFVQVCARQADFSVIAFDLDLFKSINDNFGHATGDWALKKVVKVVKSILRDGDIFARMGGEEFVILLPFTDETKAIDLAEKCRKALGNIDSHHSGHDFTLSASFGVTQNTESDLSLDPMLQRADNAVYAGKAQGGNKVVMADKSMNKVFKPRSLTQRARSQKANS
ncbi:tetratricopeptide repeat-containing diguanylate cyclase [Shewanella surugensis]|uniref:diguanylate cyclase n=1 Tax=Shewanella surugensis TaxID=212020 RepID=A0ABT0L753_9GAMM|nr:GGDEF domain-containing protein [Shewanella surugensis]MCL1123508.1 GGDEF domain-containing protein [Shewanella surugensis]